VEEIAIDVGNLVCHFSFNRPDLLPELSDRYEQFIVSKEGDIHFHVEIVDQMGEIRADRGYNPGLPNVQFEGDCIRYFRRDFHVEYYPEKQSCRVEMIHNLFGFDALFRVFYSIFLVRHESFILHACALIRKNRGYVFTGSEYAGKSAITMMKNENIPLTDELTIIRKEAGIFQAYGTPFWGEFHKGGANRGIPTFKFYFLEHSDETYVQIMEGPVKMKKVLANILNFAADRKFYNQLLATLTEFFASVPAAQLYCVPDEKVWDVVDADAGNSL